LNAPVHQFEFFALTYLRYAITWLKINRVEGQHLENFIPNAYQKWRPIKKITGQNLGLHNTKIWD
jgi:hypothetical protein